MKGKFGTRTILPQDNLAPQFIDIYWTFIANSNYTLPNLEHDSTRLFWPTIGMSVSDSLCTGPLRAGGEFYPILVQITTMNHDDNIFSAVIKGLSTMNQISVIPNCVVPNCQF